MNLKVEYLLKIENNKNKGESNDVCMLSSFWSEEASLGNDQYCENPNCIRFLIVFRRFDGEITFTLSP
jgi:hypothetical protein